MARPLSPDAIRIGTVTEVDPAAAVVRVRVGEIETAPIPWATLRAGDLRIWSPPSEGEQVIVICPDGDWQAAFVHGSLFCDPIPAPDNSGRTLMLFDDGAALSYDMQSGELSIDLSEPAGSVEFIAPGGVAIEGDVTINGNVTVSEDVIASGISLTEHTHGGVDVGSGSSGAPE